MGLDPLSPAAPARIRALLVPIGRLRQSRFASFSQRLEKENVVRLGDVTPDNRPHRTLFSPLAFPEGLIVYDLSAASPPPSHQALVPFELYRQPLLVVGVLDGLQEDGELLSKSVGGEKPEFTGDIESLQRSLDDLRADYPNALLHQLIIFDYEKGQDSLSAGVISIPPPEKSRTTTVKTVMCDMTSRLLGEFTMFAKNIQHGQRLETPKALNAHAVNDRMLSALPSHLNGSSRPGSSSDRPRSFSPIGDDLRSNHRISLPAQMTSSGTSRSVTPDGRTTTPPSGPPPSAMVVDEPLGESKVPLPPSPRKSSQDRSRTTSLELGSRQIRSDSLGDREKTKIKGRVGVVLGGMYLLAGRWPDAAKELVQSANITRANSDYVWQAKGLDYLLVCLLMYAWAGMDFRIPDILRPGAERPGLNASKSSNRRTSTSLQEASVPQIGETATRLLLLQSLAEILPDLINNILNLYCRAWTFTEEKIPPLSYSHSTIRFTKLLAAIRRETGNLNDNVLRSIVLNRSPQKSPAIKTKVLMSASELSNLLFRAYPIPSGENSMPLSERTNILAAIASVLSELGFHRKKAIILKEMLSTLLPALVQARKDGAAEMGVHPAASLASLNAASSNGFEDLPNSTEEDAGQAMQHFLSLVCHSFGLISRDRVQAPNHTKGNTGTDADAQEIAISITLAIQQASLKYVGNQDLKVDILRCCINICEALPNLAGALQYSAELLRTAGRGIAPGPESSNSSPMLPIEEQMRLANNISRTLGAAQHLGLRHPEAEYWDEFLVRGIENIDLNPSKSLIPHAKSELEIVETIETKKEKNPFIYNPFLKANASIAAEALLVAEDEAIFRVTLQNLYDFDIHIERIQLEADENWFKSHPQSTMIGPYRTQTMLLSGIPQVSGTINITGCLVKIRGCRERSFSIFKDPWEFKVDVKGRNIQPDIATVPRRQRDSSEMNSTKRVDGPKSVLLPLTIIAAQPILQLAQISLPQSAIMLLEGEIQTFTMTLHNISQTTPADLILLSFTDSTASQVQSALASKELSEIELYELELSVSRKPSFRWLRARSPQEGVKINPGGKTTIEIEVRGEPGLSFGTIQVDYSHLGVHAKDIDNKFFTRQLKIPVAVTVNASVDLVRTDLSPLPGDFSLQQRFSHDNNLKSPNKPEFPNPISAMTDLRPRADVPIPHTLLLLDFRNSWPSVLNLSVTLANQTTLHSIPPGTTIRLPLPLHKIHLPTSHTYNPIPSLNPATARQFVVSTSSKHSPEAQLALREAFWFREELLSQLSARWVDESTGRSGEVEMRTLRLTGRMVSVIRLGDVGISMTVHAAEPDAAASMPEPVKQVGTQTFHVATGSFLSLTTTIRNRAEVPIRPLLRLQPTLAGQPHNVALDLGKKLLVNGILQRVLPVLEPGEEKTVETGFCVLSTGLYEWNACVEEVKTMAKVERGKQRSRAKTGDLDVMGSVGRRLWYSDVPCIIVARDGDNEA